MTILKLWHSSLRTMPCCTCCQATFYFGSWKPEMSRYQQARSLEVVGAITSKEKAIEQVDAVWIEIITIGIIPTSSTCTETEI